MCKYSNLFSHFIYSYSYVCVDYNMYSSFIFLSFRFFNYLGTFNYAGTQTDVTSLLANYIVQHRTIGRPTSCQDGTPLKAHCQVEAP